MPTGDNWSPIPLNTRPARSLGAETIRNIEAALAAGVEYARANPARQPTISVSMPRR